MPDRETIRTLPPKWGDDPLSEFLGLAFSNTLATFVHKKSEYERLVRIDGAFLKVCQNLINPKNLVSALLILRTHSAFRAGCHLAMSGQITESFPVLRACLEYALYALHINQNPQLGEVWIRRHDDEKSLRTVKKEFIIGNVKNTLLKMDKKLSQIVDDLYKRAIDFGGHPNERAITGSMIMERDDRRIEVKQIYLHGDSLSLAHGIKTTAQIGLASLCIFRIIFRERFEILGVSAKMDELRREL